LTIGSLGATIAPKGGRAMDDNFTLELTPQQLKIVHSALRSMLSDFGHDQPDVHAIIREVLAKLPGDEVVRGIQIGGGRRVSGV
jgi:hypothetical protein